MSAFQSQSTARRGSSVSVGRKMKRLLPLLFLCVAFATFAQAFQIDLPKHYRRDLAAKQDREMQVLWRELDRGAIETALRAFVAENPSVDGVDLSRSVEKLVWTPGSDESAIKVGDWIVTLKEWEYQFPPLKRLRWGEAELFVGIEYDYKTKKLGAGGVGFIRLCFSLRRTGSLFSKKVIRPALKSSDFGELFLILPFGGTELRKANQRPDGTAAEAPPSNPSQGAAVPHP